MTNAGTEIRVRYAECDMQGRVFNAHYLTWFDIAHTDAICETLGVSLPDLNSSGIDFVVSESGVRYLAPAHFDDRLLVEVAFEPPTTTSLTSRVTVRRDGEPIATGFLRHVCVDATTWGKRAWPDEIREKLVAAALGPDQRGSSPSTFQ